MIDLVCTVLSGCVYVWGDTNVSLYLVASHFIAAWLLFRFLCSEFSLRLVWFMYWSTDLQIHVLIHWFMYWSSLPSARQHPSHGDCLEVKREYYQNCSVLGCVTQCSRSAAHSHEQFLHIQQIGFVTWDPYAMHRGGCLELYYCNIVEWSWWDSGFICKTN